MASSQRTKKLLKLFSFKHLCAAVLIASWAWRQRSGADGADRLAFTPSLSLAPRDLRNAAKAIYESAPDWIGEVDTANVTKIDDLETHFDSTHENVGTTGETGASALETASRSLIDQIISDMALDDPDVVKARISSGNMNFEDFVATTTVMTQADSSALSVPSGYEKLIKAMTLEERRNPNLFQATEPAVDERVSRIASDASVDAGVASTFLKDFGSIQRFFARMQSGGKKGALRESMEMAAEYLADKPRRIRRQKEGKNKLLKKAGQELREKKVECILAGVLLRMFLIVFVGDKMKHVRPEDHHRTS